MSRLWVQFRILYYSYLAHFENEFPPLNAGALSESEDFKVIKNDFFSELKYLSGHNYLLIEDGWYIRISSKGIDTVSDIMENFLKFIISLNNPIMQGDINNLIAIKERDHIFFAKEFYNKIKNWSEIKKPFFEYIGKMSRLESNNLSQSIDFGSIDAVNKIFITLENINKMSSHKLSCKIFCPPLNIQSNLINASQKNDDGSFTLILACIGTIIDRICYDDIKKNFIPKRNGSINILEDFLKEKKVKYNPDTIQGLRLLYDVRSRKSPIHDSGKDEVKDLLKIISKYPPTDYFESSQIVLKKFLSCLEDMQKWFSD